MGTLELGALGFQRPQYNGPAQPWKTYWAGNTYNGVPLTVTADLGISAPSLLGLIPHQTLDGLWWLKGNLYFNLTTPGIQVLIDISDCQVPTPSHLFPFTFYPNRSGYAYNNGSGGIQLCVNYTSSYNLVLVEFEIPLAARPAWADVIPARDNTPLWKTYRVDQVYDNGTPQIDFVSPSPSGPYTKTWDGYIPYQTADGQWYNKAVLKNYADGGPGAAWNYYLRGLVMDSRMQTMVISTDIYGAVDTAVYWSTTEGCPYVYSGYPSAVSYPTLAFDGPLDSKPSWADTVSPSGVGPGTKTYFAGQTYNGIPLVLTSGMTVVTQYFAGFVPYQTSDGQWWLRGVVSLDHGSYFNQHTLTLNGCQLPAGVSDLAITPFFYGSSANSSGYYGYHSYVYTSGSDLGFFYVNPEGGYPETVFSFRIPLAGKPTWAD